MVDKKIFADIILPLGIAGTFTYSVPEELTGKISVGMRVIVPFGSRKYYSGIVYRLHHNPPEGFKIRDIESVIDQYPVINQYQLDFWKWISDYYLCTPGEVLKAALPSGLKLESETKLYLNKIPDGKTSLGPEEKKLVDVLDGKKSLSMKELVLQTKIRHPERWINLLLQKNIVSSDEQIVEKYHPRTETYFKLNESYHNKGKLDELLHSLGRAPKQLSFLLSFLKRLNTDVYREEGLSKTEMKKFHDFTISILQSLVRKGIFISWKKEITRLESEKIRLSGLKSLTSIQQTTLEEVNRAFRDKKVVLLHGITSSGKTEIYFHLIKEQINKGKQVLYLLPEIVLTAQIVKRLRSVFGNQVGIYHSRYSDAERVETYFHLAKESRYHTLHIILGARSAIFLPFRNLGLIIVDEEHENTYKQQEPAPRYHARDAAIMLASMHNASVLLGTATPSFESYFNAISGKYGFVRLSERYSKIELPEIRVVNLREQYRKKLMKSHFTGELLTEMKKTLQNKQQVILFQNRRGFSLYIECVSCGWVPVCRACDVSLTYHKNEGRLICHYCGYSVKLPGNCTQCHEPALQTRGFGTEMIEEELGIFFPGARIIRFDLDTAHSRKQYEKIILDFEQGRTDILAGTQIVSKGLDFDNVGLVGILNADNLLKFPDFRAYERSFQLLLQVAGRAGRKHNKGLVIIQTSDPGNVVITSVLSNDFESFYRNQMEERKVFRYPPYNRLMKISLRHRKVDTVSLAAKDMTLDLGAIKGIYILGPHHPHIGKIKNWYIQDILIKLPRTVILNEVKEKIKTILQQYGFSGKYKGLQIIPDVDPY